MTSLADLLAAHDLLPLAWSAATDTGRLLADQRPETLRTEAKSTPTDVVTHMDQLAEARIVARLLAERPDDGVLGEEGGERTGTSGVRWVLDPIDGTVNYLYRVPLWSVSVAAERDGEVVVGVICQPDLDVTYVAARGAGAWRVVGSRAERLRVSDCADLGVGLVATGFAYDAATRAEQGAVAARVLPQVRDLRRSGSSTVDLCWVAAGLVDGYYERGLHPWDYSAGRLIAQEAGAVAAAPDGDPSSLLIVATPGIESALRGLVSDDAGRPRTA